MTTAHIQVAGIPLFVEYAGSERTATISRVRSSGSEVNIMTLLAPDVLNSIRVACVRHARDEAAFIARRIDEERSEP